MINTKKVSSWKYFLTLPAIALCFSLMSAGAGSDQRVRKGNITTFRGNTLEWQPGESSVYEIMDPVTGENISRTINHEDRIVKVNGHEVTAGTHRDVGTFGFTSPVIEEIAKNIEKALLQHKAEIPVGIAYIQIHDLVMDKNLNVYYYDVRTGGTVITDTVLSGLNKFPAINKLVDQTLKNKKLINPDNKKLDKDYYTFMTGVGFSPVELKVKLVNPEDAQKFNGAIQIRN